MGGVQVGTEAWHNDGKADVLRCEELKLLETPNGRRLDNGVGMLLDDATTGQTGLTDHVHGAGGVLELGAEGGDEGAEALGKALVDLDKGRGRGHEEVEHQGEGVVYVVAEHWAPTVRDQGKGMQGPHLGGLQ